MKFTEHIFKDLQQGENIDSYATSVVAIILVGLNGFGVTSQQTVLSLTLGVLALITITNVGNRYRLEKVMEQLSTNSKDDVIEKFPQDFTTCIETAKELWLTGMHHSSLMSEHYGSFEKMVRNGGKLRVMLADPSGAACVMTAMRFAGDVDPEQERLRTRSNLSSLQGLCKVAPDKVEIRLLDYLFEYSAILIDPNSSDGVVFIQRYTFKMMGGARKPKLVYKPSDGKWYNLYRAEILAIWECGKAPTSVAAATP